MVRSKHLMMTLMALSTGLTSRYRLRVSLKKSKLLIKTQYTLLTL